MQIAFFYAKDIQIFWGELRVFIENLEMTQITEGRVGSHVLCVIMTLYIQKSICDTPLRTLTNSSYNIMKNVDKKACR